MGREKPLVAPNKNDSVIRSSKLFDEVLNTRCERIGTSHIANKQAIACRLQDLNADILLMTINHPIVRLWAADIHEDTAETFFGQHNVVLVAKPSARKILVIVH